MPYLDDAGTAKSLAKTQDILVRSLNSELQGLTGLIQALVIGKHFTQGWPATEAAATRFMGLAEKTNDSERRKALGEGLAAVATALISSAE